MHTLEKTVLARVGVLEDVVKPVRDARDLPLLLLVPLSAAFPPGPRGPCSHSPANNLTLADLPEMGGAGGVGGPPVGAGHVGGVPGTP